MEQERTGDSPESGAPQNGTSAAPNGSLAIYRGDPEGFVRGVLGATGKPYGKQVEMFLAAAHHRRVSVVGCNGSGKDWAAARIVLWWMETRQHAKAVVTGPTQRQVEEVVWRELRVAYAAAADRLHGRVTASRYVINDHRFALGFSTDSPFNLQGFHSPNLLVVVTEAHAVAQQHMDALKRLNPKLLLLTGNPLVLSGEFYDSHHAKRALYSCISISAYDTPNLGNADRTDAGSEEIPGMLTRQDVEERRREWGEDNPLYVASVLGQFPASLEDTLIPLTAIQAAVARWPTRLPQPDEPWVLGVDVARFGADRSALCLRKGTHVETLAQFHHADTMQLTGRIVDLVQRHGVAAIFVDAAGVGGGVVDRLRELGQPVVEVQAGASARHPERFANLRAEMYWGLRRRFQDGAIAVPDDAELMSQLAALRYDFTSRGQVQIEEKTQMRSRGLPSPDKADAVALAFMAPASLEVWI